MIAPTLDTTGSTLLLAQILTQNSGTFSSISDSKGNTWTQVGTSKGYAGIGAGSYMFKCETPIVGTGHTFQLNKTATYENNESALFIVAISNSSGVGNFTYTGNNAFSGSVTTSANDSLVVQFWGPADYSGGGNVFTQPSGWTMLNTIDPTAGYTTNQTANMNTSADAYVQVPTSGTAVTGTWSASLTVQSTESMWTIEVKR